MKRILSLLLLLAATMFSPALHAQGHFDWVKSYSGPSVNQGPKNSIVGSVTDSVGNICILGMFTPGARIDGVDLLPIAAANNICTVIAKISDQGSLLWHKSIYYRKGGSLAHDITKVGDSAFMVMVSFMLPYRNSNSNFNDLYYLDTLLTEDDGYLVNTDSIGSYVVNGFITFDFDGNVIEQNFVQVALVGNDGQPFWSNAGAEIGRMDTRILSNELLTVDPMGNIYVCRPTSDRFGERCDTCPNGYYEYSFENGGVSALRIIVNGNRSFDFTPSERPSLLNKQVMIFSPHFDSVIGNFYLFDNEHFPANVSPHIVVFSMDIDNENNIFLTVTGDMLHNWDGNQVLYKFANSDSLYYITSAEVYSDAFLIKFDPNLRAQFVCSLQFTDDPTHFSKGSNMSSISIDESSNTLFLLGGTQRDPLFETTEGVYVMYRGDTIDLRNNLFWLRIDKDDGHLYSYGKARSSVTTGTKGGVKASDLVVANNRVIAQLGYQSELSFRDTTISLNPTYQGSGLMIWDYDGHEIEYLDHQANAPGNRVNILKLVDSSLFVGGMMVSSATFGSFSLPATAGGTAFIAHYTDTAFMTPYVYNDTTGNGGGNGGNGDDTNDVRIVMAEDGNAFVAYPNPFRQRINVEYSGQQPITAAYLTDIMGRTEQVELSATAPGRYTLDLTARPQAAYLLTLVTQDGHRHTVRLLKQSEVFGN